MINNHLLILVALTIFSYLFGSIPSAYLAGKINSGVDIRQKGTGNMGATNVLIVIGPVLAVFVYSFDLLKGLIPVLIAKKLLGTDVSMGLAGLAAVLGHDFPLFLGFSGGKGVATAAGVFMLIEALQDIDERRRDFNRRREKARK